MKQISHCHMNNPTYSQSDILFRTLQLESIKWIREKKMLTIKCKETCVRRVKESTEQTRSSLEGEYLLIHWCLNEWQSLQAGNATNFLYRLYQLLQGQRQYENLKGTRKKEMTTVKGYSIDPLKTLFIQVWSVSSNFLLLLFQSSYYLSSGPLQNFFKPTYLILHD